MMKAAGINIIFSIPGLKVHAKVALVLRRDKEGRKLTSYAYISTGNFNEKTATLYADSGLFTCNPVIVNDLHNLFRTLQGKENPVFHRLLVARFNLIPELNRLINHEIELTRQGKQGRIILKMNALQDPAMIRPPLRSLASRCRDRPHCPRHLLPHPRAGVQPQHPRDTHRGYLSGTCPCVVLRQRRRTQALPRLAGLDAA